MSWTQYSWLEPSCYATDHGLWLDNHQPSQSILSRASAHGRSQLKRYKLRVGSYTKEVLECLHASACPRCLPGALNQPASLLHPRFIKASLNGGKHCIVLESRLTRSLVYNLSTKEASESWWGEGERPCITWCVHLSMQQLSFNVPKM